jgi:hypothetical protein
LVVHDWFDRWMQRPHELDSKNCDVERQRLRGGSFMQRLEIFLASADTLPDK